MVTKTRLRLGKKAERGDAIIEGAIVLVFFLMVLFGIVDFGRALYAYHFVSEAAREATRWAAVNGATCSTDNSCDGVVPMTHSGPVGPTDDGTIQTYVRNLAPGGIVQGNVTATANWPGNASNCARGALNAPGCPVQVKVAYPFRFLAPIVSTATISMSSSSEMVISH